MSDLDVHRLAVTRTFTEYGETLAAEIAAGALIRDPSVARRGPADPAALPSRANPSFASQLAAAIQALEGPRSARRPGGE